MGFKITQNNIFTTKMRYSLKILDEIRVENVFNFYGIRLLCSNREVKNHDENFEFSEKSQKLKFQLHNS